MTQYKRPPITEAVIEIRLEQPLTTDMVNALHNRLKNDYVNSEQMAGIRVKLDVPQRQIAVNQQDDGYKLTSEDRVDILMINPGSMSCSRLAPYEGWDAFRARAEDVWRKWKRITGYRKISRLGVRYINRIDIPTPENNRIKVEDYLSAYPAYPEPDIPEISTYTMQLSAPVENGAFILILNSGAKPSPLVGHISLILDLDIVRAEDVPQKDDQILEMLDSMRDHKNRIFESCITDNARKLFQE